MGKLRRNHFGEKRRISAALSGRAVGMAAGHDLARGLLYLASAARICRSSFHPPDDPYLFGKSKNGQRSGLGNQPALASAQAGKPALNTKRFLCRICILIPGYISDVLEADAQGHAGAQALGIVLYAG